MSEQEVITQQAQAPGETAEAEKELPNEEEESETGKQIKQLKKAEKGVRFYQYFLLRLLIFLIVLWILFFKVVGITHMPSGDMYPRIDAGDMILFYRLDKDVKFRDIIVIEKAMPNSTQKETVVSRVIAVGGDTVEITDTARVIVNGNSLAENTVFYPTPRYEGYTRYPLTLAEDECFVLSDYRNGGTDSRYFGPVKKKEIAGTVISVMRRNNL